MKQDDDLIVKPTTRITPDSNVSLIDPNMGDERSYLDNYDSYDSYIYGDADATVEDTIETMTVYDPDSERYEDIDLSSDDEVVNLHEAVCGPLVQEPGNTRVAEAQGDNTPLTRADLLVYDARQAARDRVGAAKLPQVEFEALCSAKAAMPAWMVEALRRYEEGAVAHG